MTGSKSNSDPPGAARIRIAGLAAALAMAALLALVGGERTGRPLFDLYQRLAPRDLSASQVEVVWIDPPSLAAVGPWPWPRYHVARLIEEIAGRGATVIGLDALFPERDRMNPDQFAALYPELTPGAAAEIRGLQSFDTALADAIGRHPVVLGRAGTMEPAAGDAANLPVEALFTSPLPGSAASYPHALANIPDLDEVAIGHGILNGAPDPDGIVRRIPLTATVAGQPTPGFALEIARLATGNESVTPGISGDVLRSIGLGARTVATDPDGRMRLHFGRFPADNIVSAADVLRQGFPADAFVDKIVLIGLAAEGTQDVVATPIAAETFGVLLQAQAVDTILRGGWLSRPYWAPVAEWLAALAFVLLVLALSPMRRRRTLAIPAAAAGAILAASVAAFAGWGILLDPAPPLLVGGAAAAGILVSAFRNARSERERLRDALLSERLSAAEAAGELQAARDIQIGMLPPRAKLAALDSRLDIDALLEPARSVGGDFYDAMRLGRDKIGFVIGDVTGKGVPASLFMAVSKALTKSILLREEGDLASAAAMIDRELARDNEAGMGVTMIIGIIDLATGAATLCNAGHENPLLVTADGDVADLPMEGGPPFCVVDGYRYPVERIRLAPGETLVLVTDGVTEAQDAEGNLFGHARAVESLRGATDARSATEALMSAVRAFEEGTVPSDDLTVLAIGYRGPAA